MPLEDTIREEITDIKNLLLERNDAVAFSSNSLTACRNLISNIISTANASSSYDEKIDTLVTGLKQILDYHEKSLLDLMTDLKKYRTQIETLEQVLEKSSTEEESKKKDPESPPPE